MSKTTYTVRELAACVGVSTATLRAWERRYGFMAPDRTSGGHRLYTETDLKLFIYINHLRSMGQSLVRLSELGREALLDQAAKYFKDLGNTQSESAYESQVAQSVVSALESRDTQRAFDLLDRSAVTSTSPTEFANLTMRIMTDIGSSWEQGKVSVSVEHLFTSRVRFLLAEQFYRRGNALHAAGKKGGAAAEAPGRGPRHVPVVVAGLEGEAHEIGLLRVAIFLQDWGASVAFLGANLPLADLEGFAAEYARSHPFGENLMVCAGVSSHQTAQAVHTLASDLNASLARRHITILGGSGTRHLGPADRAKGDLVVTENLEVLQAIYEAIAGGALHGLAGSSRREALKTLSAPSSHET